MDEDAELLEKLGALARSTADIQARPALSDSIMAAVFEDAGEPLARISLATAEIEPEERLSDAVMARVEAAEASPTSFERRPRFTFDEIARATAEVRPPIDFTDAVMAKLPKVGARKGFADGLMRSARATLLVAGFAAAASVVFSWYTERSADEQTVASLFAEDGE